MIDIRFAGLLEQRTGLSAALLGISAVERAVQARIRTHALPGDEAYWDVLQRSPEEMQALIEAVVVPETWFFRDAQAFAAMARAAVAQAARGPHPLRLLSLPCSTGEEPYTMAMALLDAGLPPGRFRIDAFDISAGALRLARRGVYGRNSFRGADLAFRERHFEPEAGEWRLRPGVKACVDLARGNVADEGFLAGLPGYDIIFCRNLLIYFDPATQKRVLGGLGRVLAPQGLLFVGHSEAGVATGCGFASAGLAMAFAFRHPPAPEVARPAPPPPFTLAPASRFSPITRRLAAEPRPAALPPTTRLAPSPTLDGLWQLVNAGRLEEAARHGEAYVRSHGPSADALMLMGLIRDAQGQGAAAASYYRKVLYLAPHHAEALDHLALLLRRQGDLAGARRLGERLRRQHERAR